MPPCSSRMMVLPPGALRTAGTAKRRTQLLYSLFARTPPPQTAAARAPTKEHLEHLALQQPHLGRVATRRPSNPNLELGDHGAIFSSAPPLRPDGPRTPGRRQMASQPAVSTEHPAVGTPALSRGHLSRGHIRTASTRLDRASYA
jgi:hypothetical protein